MRSGYATGFYSIMFNILILDETPVNCERFLRHEGLRLFQVCYAQFPNETELVRNMMGLIGNIAEDETLRGQLMHDEYIKIFSYVFEIQNFLLH